VTPIVLVDNSAFAGEISGTANIAGTNLVLDLNAYASALPLMLIDAPNGHLSGTFGTVTFVGSRTATVNYDTVNGNVFLSNFLNGAGAGTVSLADGGVPEPSGLMLVLTLGLLLFTFAAETNRRTRRLVRIPCRKTRA
jgi:hypothetical protein